MSEPLYNIVFSGDIQPGKDKEIVMQHVAKLFKTVPAKISPLFSGGRKVIKSNVNAVVAKKYRAALLNAGMVIRIEAANAQAAAKPKAKPAAQAATKPAAKPEAPKTPSPDTSGITMAEVGADVLDHPIEVTPQPIGDISDISMAEVGADVLDHPIEVTPQPIGDISDISMAEVGADVIENPKEKEKAPIPDISNLSLE